MVHDSMWQFETCPCTRSRWLTRMAMHMHAVLDGGCEQGEGIRGAPDTGSRSSGCKSMSCGDVVIPALEMVYNTTVWCVSM